MSLENGAAGAPGLGTAGRNGERVGSLEGATHTSRRPDYTRLLETLAELFPVFTAERWRPHKPLKIGIHRDLVDRGVLRSKECRAIGYYVRRRLYQVALAAGGPRYDLDGNASGEVTPEEAEAARLSLASMDTKAAEKAAGYRVARQAERTAAKEARALAADERKPDPPIHEARPAKAPVRLPPERPRRLGLSDLRAAYAARRAAP